VYLGILCWICGGKRRDRKLLSVLLIDADYIIQARNREVAYVCVNPVTGFSHVVFIVGYRKSTAVIVTALRDETFAIIISRNLVCTISLTFQ
jgi:hypothetical protein